MLQLLFYAALVALVAVKVRDVAIARNYGKGPIEALVSPPPGKTWQSVALIGVIVLISIAIGAW